jgi:hypothetical protein
LQAFAQISTAPHRCRATKMAPSADVQDAIGLAAQVEEEQRGSTIGHDRAPQMGHRRVGFKAPGLEIILHGRTTKAYGRLHHRQQL